MSIKENIIHLKEKIKANPVTLVAVSKTKPNELIQEAYDAGQRIFGENKVQELVNKQEVLPQDIEWHMIGHLQSNKVKYIAPFVNLIHAIDSLKLLKEVNKQALKNDRIINCLLQIHIAEEESKFGLSENELKELLNNEAFAKLKNICVVGLMGMATYTHNETQIHKEFASLTHLFTQFKDTSMPNVNLKEISMGMSGDYPIAIEEGSTMIRVGSAIFGSRN